VLDGNEALRLRARRTTTAHEGNALELLHLARLLGTLPPRVVILGIEPGEVRTGLGLTGEVEAALPQALERARGALQEFIETAV
jgi:hydrogenase maturation protease